MRVTIWAGSAVALLSASCAATGQGDRTPCAELEQACRARCDRDFEDNPSSWDYRSCLESCKPDPGAICVR